MANEEDKTSSKSWAPWLWTAWLSLLAFFASIAGGFFGLIKNDKLDEGFQTWLLGKDLWSRWVIGFMILLSMFGVSAIFILLIQVSDKRKQRAIGECEREKQRKIIELENLEVVFRDRERIRMLDPITGIPNYQSWKADLAKWASQGLSKNEFSLIVIDLDNFKWLNKQSRTCADKVLRFFARKTYDSMRRDELLYKLPSADYIINAPQMYRNYQGGDEFFFIISGDVWAAIGFLNRLAERTSSYKGEIREQILIKFVKNKADADRFTLSFAAAIMPIAPGTDWETARPNAFELLDRAKESEMRLLVIFDENYEDPREYQAQFLKPEIKRIKDQISDLDKKSGAKSSEEDHRAEALRMEQRKLDAHMDILNKAEQIFTVRVSNERFG